MCGPPTSTPPTQTFRALPLNLHGLPVSINKNEKINDKKGSGSDKQVEKEKKVIQKPRREKEVPPGQKD